MFETVEFTGSFTDLSSLKNRLPEVVIAGRSNAGKSSFINHITGKAGIARVSSTPGKTRALNYIRIDGAFYFVDLPGYGYAKVSKTERDRWSRFIGEYFKGSEHVRMIIHLVDSRVPGSSHDLEFHEFCSAFSPGYIMLLTKTDKLNQSEMSSAMKAAEKCYPGMKAFRDIFPYTIRSGKFKKHVVNAIRDHLN
ncbi:MAG: putative GTP-binding protein EngB [Ignavibacteriaceae bacterium]|nr:MAG: YihA family ribosome biogenesis GTP-binding protein [Chlorobiota bacterium]GJQ32402.1 MAG: putative GTP-binding protein EngB [Ignavibacteriaceae bacterium]